MASLPLRLAAGVAGAAVVAAATHANVMRGGGYETTAAPLTITIAVMMCVGLAFAASSFKDGARGWAILFGVSLIAGELYWAGTNAEREMADRAERERPMVEAKLEREKALDRIAKAQVAVSAAPATSPRLEAAIAAKAAADRAVVEKSAEMGCRTSCAALLQAQVDKAQAEVDAARRDLAGAAAAAKGELDAARADLQGKPEPLSANPLTDKIGVAGWAWDLCMAGLRTLGVIGGSIGIGMAVHPKRKTPAPAQQRAASEMAEARAQRVQAMQERPKAPPASAPATARLPARERVLAFLSDVVVLDPKAKLSLRDLFKRYYEWEEGDPLAPLEFGKEIRGAFAARRLKVTPKGQDVVVHGAKMREALAPPRSSAA